ncbi:hypothetical protein [Corynebacterium freneyi]|uniref:hypothetical protein n=1 Tax=Corynebacterium freneyi TaxID=134034 RepID=UPI001CCDDB09|nr:hypothetical protein [Corynebacterium freneyi]UBI01598.1 hypothetical protein LA334_08680 [Corynebacterium freneyi]
MTNTSPPSNNRPGMHPHLAHVALAGQPNHSWQERWEIRDEVQNQLDWLEGFDKYAYDYLLNNLEKWAIDGFPNFNPRNTDTDGLSAPCGKRLRRKLGPQRPWMCEAKTHETEVAKRPTRPPKAKRQWRMYFIDVTSVDGEPDHVMAGVHFAEKWVSNRKQDDNKVTKRQDQDMTKAATHALRWCPEVSRDYRRDDEFL